MKARAEIVVDGRISDAEALWFDTRRWATFVEGFHHAAKGLEGWPSEGTLVWDSVPGGRGRVTERVLRHEQRVGQTVEFEDEKTTGTQTVTFASLDDDRVRVSLDLDYRVKDLRGGPLGAVVDALFIRPRQRDALARTLHRFARELAAEREPVDP